MKINDIILKEGLWDSMRSAAFNLTGGKAGGGITGEAQRIFVTNFIQYFDAAKRSAKGAGIPLRMSAFLNAYMKRNKIEPLEYQTDVDGYASQSANDVNPTQLANLMYMISSQEKEEPTPVPEGVMDHVGNFVSGFTGGLGTGGLEGGTRRNFVISFERQLDAAKKSAEQSGVPLKTGAFIKTWLTNNKVDPGEYKDEVAKYMQPNAVVDPKQLANLMYMISSQAKENPSGAPGNPAAAAGSPRGAKTGTVATQIISLIKTLNKRNNEYDLNQIAKAALNKLYKINVAGYAALRQQIITGAASKAPAAAPAASTTPAASTVPALTGPTASKVPALTGPTASKVPALTGPKTSSTGIARVPNKTVTHNRTANNPNIAADDKFKRNNGYGEKSIN